MKQTGLRRLSPKDFNATLLEELTRQGRVFIAPIHHTDKDAYKREILDYVRRIADYAADGWQEDIEALWQQIVDAQCFADCLVMKKGIQAGHMNKYTVTNIVCMMHNKGVYRAEVSMMSLHLRMENTPEKNKYFMSSGNYALQHEARMFLKQLLLRV